MDKFIGTKVIKARPEPMTYAEYCKIKGWDCPEGRENEIGYMVGYPNAQGEFKSTLEGCCDYISWSPQDVFDAAYKPMTGMSFGLAIEALRAGHKVARAGWNGKGMFIVYMSPLYLPPYSTEDTARKVNDRTAKWIGEDTPLDSQGYFAIFTAQKKWQPGWSASQADMLAEDWMIAG